MSEYKKIVVNVQTGEQWIEPVEPEVVADMQAEAVRLASLPTEEELAQTKAIAEAKRKAALAKLEALGLDEDDLKALGL